MSSIKQYSGFQKFWDIFSFKKENNNNIIEQQKNDIVKRVDYLLANDKHDLVCQFLENGYLFQHHQYKFIMEKFSNSWSTHDSLKIYKDRYETLLRQKSPQTILDYFNDAYKELNVFSKNMEVFNKESTKCTNLSTCLYTFKDLLKNDTEFFNKWEKLCNKKIEFYSNIKFSNKSSDKQAYCRYARDKFKELKERLDTYYINFNQESLQNELNATKTVFSLEGIKENIINDISKNINKIRQKNLPQSAQLNLDTINEFYLIMAQAPTISENDKFRIENLYQKRLPQVLEEYLTISDNYKNKLKTADGKNADDLLLDSLHEIKVNLEQIVQTYQENQLHKLSATNRYLKNI